MSLELFFLGWLRRIPPVSVEKHQKLDHSRASVRRFILVYVAVLWRFSLSLYKFNATR